MIAAESAFTRQEMMTIAAARMLSNEDVCLVGIGAPSIACNLARFTHAPDIKLIYESGTIDVRPYVLPLSIGDSELCETALTVVSLPEIFRYWLQGGRISIGFLGGAQIDRHANLNSTVIGSYDDPAVRLPGAGGAPEIALGCREVFIIMEMEPRKFVEKLSFVTTLGHGAGSGDRVRLGVTTKGPTKVITDLCILEPDPLTKELLVVSIHPGHTHEYLQSQCGWPLKFSPQCTETPEPSRRELEVLRDLQKRTYQSHEGN